MVPRAVASDSRLIQAVARPAQAAAAPVWAVGRARALDRKLRTTEVIVLGGGTAGAATARMLARLGRDVVVVAGSSAEAPPLGESLPPSVAKPLRALDLLGIVEAAGFPRSGGNVVAWGGSEPRRAEFQGPLGFQVERNRFSELLLDAAEASGATVLRGAVARLSNAEQSVPRRVEWRSEDDSGALEAPWVLDATGRNGVLARRGYRAPRSGPVTIALVGLWRPDRRIIRKGRMDPGHDTLVESYQDGWGWSVPLDDSLRFVAVMVDPRATGLRRPAGLGGMYRAELAKTRLLSAMLAEARLERGPWACAATPYGALRHGDMGELLVGDAGSFLDPLSSFGVKKALASAWLAAIVADSALRTPSMTGPALELFEEREREGHTVHAALAMQHHAEAASHHRTPYWEVRSGNPGGELSPPGEAVDQEVARAFRAIRGWDRLELRVAPVVRRLLRPTVREARVVLEERFTIGEATAPLRYHRGVDLLRLLDLAPGITEAPELYEAYRTNQGRLASTSDAGAPPIAPPELPVFLEALALLVARGALVNASSW